MYGCLGLSAYTCVIQRIWISHDVKIHVIIVRDIFCEPTKLQLVHVCTDLTVTVGYVLQTYTKTIQTKFVY